MYILQDTPETLDNTIPLERYHAQNTVFLSIHCLHQKLKSDKRKCFEPSEDSMLRNRSINIKQYFRKLSQTKDCAIAIFLFEIPYYKSLLQFVREKGNFHSQKYAFCFKSSTWRPWGGGGGGESCPTYSLNHCKHIVVQSFKSNHNR